MDHQEVKQVVYQTAADMARRGLGWTQESVVLREALERLRPHLGAGLAAQQAILSAWHDLFLERKLSWGYDLDNPNWPFFHLREGVNGPAAAAVPAAAQA